MNSKILKIKNSQSGFTLIEMMVVTVIVIVIAAIALIEIANFRKGLNVESVAEEVALNIRRAQGMALAVRSTGGLLPVYQNGYGIHFELGGLGGPQDANDHSYILFIDYEANPGPGGWDRAYLKNNNMMVACGNPSQPTDECLEKTQILSGDRVTGLALCSISGGTPSCSNLTPGQSLDITFLRPNLDAYFCVNPAIFGGCVGIMPSTGYAKITLTAPTGRARVVNVWSTGQISIE